jgi:hypothetical protein
MDIGVKIVQDVINPDKRLKLERICSCLENKDLLQCVRYGDSLVTMLEVNEMLEVTKDVPKQDLRPGEAVNESLPVKPKKHKAKRKYSRKAFKQAETDNV